MSLIEIKDLAIRTPNTTLVQGVNLTLDEGERLGLIGESGSGKSLTATAAIGLLPPPLVASGSIRLKGTEVIGAADADLVPLRGTVTATVFQEPLTALDPLMTIGKQIMRPLWRRANRRGEDLGRKELERRLGDLLEQVSLPDPQRIVRSYPHEISGGQRQRVAIAMALACDADLLIADEPTTALDVTTQAEILDLLDRLVRERNMALLFISHDLPVVAGIVNNVMVLEKGLPVETGPVEQVFAHPTHPYTKRLLSAAAHFDTALDTRS